MKKVRFTQNTISPKFRDGRCVRALAAELRSNPAKAQGLPKLQVFSHGPSDTLYSLDNRRLFAMKVAGIGRVLAQKVQPKRTLLNKHLTTTSSGRLAVFHDADPIRDLVDIEVADDCTGIRPDCSHQVQLTQLGSVEPKIMTMRASEIVRIQSQHRFPIEDHFEEVFDKVMYDLAFPNVGTDSKRNGKRRSQAKRR